MQGMTDFKPIEVGGRPLGGGDAPAICVPIVARTKEMIADELKASLALRPDLIEWRADHFEGVNSLEAVSELALMLRHGAGSTPLIFTLRSAREGGAPRSLAEPAALRLAAKMAVSTLFEFVDLEAAAPEQDLRHAIATVKDSGTQLILSSHDFAATPPSEQMLDSMRRAKALGADIVKAAVMPRDMGDVLRLLAVTLRARHELEVPLITMAMGPLGIVTRSFGHQFGSSLTFAAGIAPSAPGQLPLEELRRILDIVKSRSQPR